MDAAWMNSDYEDPAFGAGFQQLFAAAPTASTWTHPPGNWVER